MADHRQAAHSSPARRALGQRPGAGPVAKLVERTAAGDAGAFAELYDTSHSSVFALALHILRDWQLAEEVTLDVYVEVWRAAGRIASERADVMAWLMTLARHRSIDRRRARDRRRTLESVPLNELDSGSAPWDSAEPAAGFIRSEQSDRVAEAIASLPAGQREAIELAYFPGLSQVEIAEKLDEPLGTVKSRIRLGMKRMKEKLCHLEND